MPTTEKALKKLILEQNVTRAHHRPLNGEYGYNHILNSNLVEECLKLYDLKRSAVRVLDIGCGDGFALNQLKNEIEQKGLGDKFEFFGLGTNLYKKMYIPRSHFIKKGAYSYKPHAKSFDLIISVFTFQYIWHKLEILEHIYHSFMSDNAKAIIHFPGYLVKFSERSSDILEGEADGNKSFARFIEEWNSSDENPRLEYAIIPYQSDDDDSTFFTDFGNLQFKKESSKPMRFNTCLSGFSVYDDGFILSAINKKISYVLSVYNSEKPCLSGAPESDPFQLNLLSAKSSSACRIVTIPKKYKGTLYNFHLGIHHLKSNKIIGIYPAAKEDLTGFPVPYQEIATALRDQNVGAVVRCNGLYDPSVDFYEFNDLFVRSFIDYILENSKNICGASRPEIYLMGYSTGGSAIASIASEYDAVKKLLLIAPSYDADKSILQKSMINYKGELYIVVGDRDEVVLPSQVAWFYAQAKKAKVRKFVELVSCEHSFNGTSNREVVSKSPFWAFKNYADFPPETVPRES